MSIEFDEINGTLIRFDFVGTIEIKARSVLGLAFGFFSRLSDGLYLLTYFLSCGKIHKKYFVFSKVRKVWHTILLIST